MGKIYREKRAALVDHLANISGDGLSKVDARAVILMRASLYRFSRKTLRLSAPSGKCSNARDPQSRTTTRCVPRLYSCFDELANNLQFEGRNGQPCVRLQLAGADQGTGQAQTSVSCVQSALGGRERERSKPGQPLPPHDQNGVGRRKKNKPAVVAAAESLGVQPADVEIWLEQILETWREVSGDTPIEPWDYDYVGGETRHGWLILPFRAIR